MNKRQLLLILGFTALTALQAGAQSRAYIGYAYPAGGQQGTTFSVRIGGQRIDGACGAIVSGSGVHAKLTDIYNRIGNQEMRLLKEQLQIIRKTKEDLDEETEQIRDKLVVRISEDVRQPASTSLSTIVLLKITIDRDAKPGLREIRILSKRGISNPLTFCIGRLPEVSREPMKISKFQLLGKEHLAQRKRPEEEEEQSITLPCTVNGQIASGEINRYRFRAHKGDRLVITTLARQLVPYIADAVPGWFQPVLTLRNTEGKEMAFNDDYRFKPDPTLLYEAPATGEYVLSITDSIYRGREDFVYRITLGETPFITSIFPPGAPAGKPIAPAVSGWNLRKAQLQLPGKNSTTGIYPVAVDRGDALSNPIPFAIDALPECIENNSDTQKITLPIIVNGRIDSPGDEDVFEFHAREGEALVAEINARRLDSPLDSIIKLTDAAGNLIAFNDDHADPSSGLNTHHADSYLRFKVPATGTYRLHLTDTARQGGEAYTYRLRLGPPQPDFALRTVPSRIDLKKFRGAIEVFAIRKDGFDAPIRLTLDTPGFTAKPVTLWPKKEKVRLNVQCTQRNLTKPTPLTITGTAKIGGKEISHQAVPSEDWMQAFLWRHLVPAQELLAYRYTPPKEPKLPLPKQPNLTGFDDNFKQMNTARKQSIGRIKRIGALYQDGLLTDELYTQTVAGLLDYKSEE